MAKQFEAMRMRAVRRLLLTTALLLTGLLLAPGAQAQGGGGMMNMSPDERADQRIGVLTERVQITAPQTEQLKPILVKQFTEQVALFQKFQGGGDRAAMMGEMQALRTKYDEQIQAVLTAEQKPKYQALLAEEAERRRNRGGPGGGGE
jgi:periplasmic protein CpxP/Spy